LPAFLSENGKQSRSLLNGYQNNQYDPIYMLFL